MRIRKSRELPFRHLMIFVRKLGQYSLIGVLILSGMPLFGFFKLKSFRKILIKRKNHSNKKMKLKYILSRPSVT